MKHSRKLKCNHVIIATRCIKYIMKRFYFFGLAFFVQISVTFIFWMAKSSITTASPCVQTALSCNQGVMNTTTNDLFYILYIYLCRKTNIICDSVAPFLLQCSKLALVMVSPCIDMAFICDAGRMTVFLALTDTCLNYKIRYLDMNRFQRFFD